MSDPLVRHFRMLARYNALVNRRLYETCARLGDAERKKERPAFFGSIHATLNHVLVGDRIWLARFGGEEVPSTNLDAVLYEDFDELRHARELEDERIDAFAIGLTEGFLSGTIRYVNNAGKTYGDPIHLLVAHFFNHQTHHRGQIHDLLTQTKVPPPILDLHRIIKPDPDGWQRCSMVLIIVSGVVASTAPSGLRGTPTVKARSRARWPGLRNRIAPRV